MLMHLPAGRVLCKVKMGRRPKPTPLYLLGDKEKPGAVWLHGGSVLRLCQLVLSR